MVLNVSNLSMLVSAGEAPLGWRNTAADRQCYRVKLCTGAAACRSLKQGVPHVPVTLRVFDVYCTVEYGLKSGP